MIKDTTVRRQWRVLIVTCLAIRRKMFFRMTEGFGLGMGCMAGTCGALSGAVLLAGLKKQ